MATGKYYSCVIYCDKSKILKNWEKNFYTSCPIKESTSDIACVPPEQGQIPPNDYRGSRAARKPAWERKETPV